MMSTPLETSSAPLADVECIHGEHSGYDGPTMTRPYAYRGDATLPRSFKTGERVYTNSSSRRGYDYEEDFWPKQTSSLPRKVANGVNRTQNVRGSFVAGGLHAAGQGYYEDHIIHGNINEIPDRQMLNDNVRSPSPSLNTSGMSSPKQSSLGSHGSISTSNSLSPHKKKAHKPSFRAFGSLIQKMMRQIRNMDESKSPGEERTTRNSQTSDAVDNLNHNQGVYLSPVTSNPLKLNGKVPGLVTCGRAGLL